MIDFLNKESSVVEYVKTHLPEFLPAGLSPPDDYVNDFIDFDKYKKNVVVWFNFVNYLYETLTNESNEETGNLKIYISVRNDSKENLRTKLLQYASALYNMFEASGTSFGGLTDDGEIENIQFYQYVEGQHSLKIVEFEITLTTEI
ncbi:hypothetical protein K7I13_12140 [Brucepastera parasyntrophica]|uniref:hypothetical protein n=1 Tax=Brucepastera parasyntrophica TaxID=2880008 RepID=UPI00210BA525|nr:hypothetical protein [Brucepastera parasyntrophica]ULQ59235.1 hypothetical protein K7I13_12140 [Brucepastera parasyntrophica]